MSEIKPDATLDVRGLFCPQPVIKCAEEIKKQPIGTILEVLATDPGTLADIPAWAKTSGNEVLKTEQDGEVIKLYVKKVQ